jgi:bifunctional DNA-binding transcriptional regulator/antitoxin component of YhaV-PrlF toxin-antitoxin module
MMLLNALTLTTFENDNALSPVLHRRQKLVAKIAEQICYATDSNYQPTKQTWHKDSEGREQRVTVPKRVRRWWTVKADGTVLLTVRYGSRALELAKGKNAIVVNSVRELPTVLKRLGEAVDKGEFDKLLDEQASYTKRVDTQKK